jgi:hypothetical protein
MGLYAGADYNLILPYLIVDSEVQISALTTTNAYECFPNYSKMEQPIGKGRVRGRGEGKGKGKGGGKGKGKGWELTLYLRIDISWSGMDNPMPEHHFIAGFNFRKSTGNLGSGSGTHGL